MSVLGAIAQGMLSGSCGVRETVTQFATFIGFHEYGSAECTDDALVRTIVKTIGSLFRFPGRLSPFPNCFSGFWVESVEDRVGGRAMVVDEDVVEQDRGGGGGVAAAAGAAAAAA